MSALSCYLYFTIDSIINLILHNYSVSHTSFIIKSLPEYNPSSYTFYWVAEKLKNNS